MCVLLAFKPECILLKVGQWGLLGQMIWRFGDLVIPAYRQAGGDILILKMNFHTRGVICL